MFWRRSGDIRSRSLSKGEEEAYNAGYDDGVGMVVEKLTSLDNDGLSPEARDFIKGLILSLAVETAASD